MSNQDQEMEMGRGLVLRRAEYWRLMKAVLTAVRLGAPAAVLEVSSSGIRFFAADDLRSPSWWLDAMFGQPFAAAGRALVAPPKAIAEALQQVVGSNTGVRFLLEGGAVSFTGPSRTVAIHARMVPFGAGGGAVPVNKNMWFDVSTDRIVAVASLPYTLLMVAMNIAAPHIISNVQLRLGRRPEPRGEWVLEVVGDVLRHHVPVVVGVRPERVPVVGRYPAAVLNKLLMIAIDELLTLEFTEPESNPALRARWVDSDWSVEFRVAPAPE